MVTKEERARSVEAQIAYKGMSLVYSMVYQSLVTESITRH